ncbi:hypothetical protein D3C84_816970 [compost metagenome]
MLLARHQLSELLTFPLTVLQLLTQLSLALALRFPLVRQEGGSGLRLFKAFAHLREFLHITLLQSFELLPFFSHRFLSVLNQVLG